MATAKCGVNVKDVPAGHFIAAFAAHLKRSGKVNLPSWVDVVKTGVQKELSPYDPDWYYTRLAALARQVYLRKGLGVGHYRRHFGGVQRRGSAPPHFKKAAGGVIRNALQQLEKLGFVATAKDGGRSITVAGRREIDRVATELVIKRQ
jgi:small subunit ribosomal protein S19e